MSFVSIEFLFFYPIVTVLYYFLPVHRRWMLLLPASVLFYLFVNPRDGFLLLAVTIVSFFLALVTFKSAKDNAAGSSLNASPRWRIPIVLSGVFLTLLPLLYYKYGHFLTTSLADIMRAFGYQYSQVLPAQVLPLGISFFSLQAVGYIADVYSRKIEPERNFFKFTLFKSFYPQLVAGPIERYSHIMKQLLVPKQPDYEMFTDGLKLFAWGVFKKVVVADNLGKIVDPIFASPGSHSPEVLIIATLAFTFQIYGDFSGYSDMALGIGKTLGIDLMKNFSLPYFARSIPEFWQRWHISLSTFFRDYLYIPLGGNRRGQIRWVINILLVFMVSGLWHGANLTFIVWGFIHALGYFWATASSNLSQKTGFSRVDNSPFAWPLRIAQTLMTFSCVSLAWIFFRSNTLNDAVHISKSIIVSAAKLQLHFTSEIFMTINERDFTLGVSAVACLLLIELMVASRIDLSLLKRQTGVVRWASYYALILGILIFGNFGRSKFIYFQF